MISLFGASALFCNQMANLYFICYFGTALYVVYAHYTVYAYIKSNVSESFLPEISAAVYL